MGTNTCPIEPNLQSLTLQSILLAHQCPIPSKRLVLEQYIMNFNYAFRIQNENARINLLLVNGELLTDADRRMDRFEDQTGDKILQIFWTKIRPSNINITFEDPHHTNVNLPNSTIKLLTYLRLICSQESGVSQLIEAWEKRLQIIEWLNKDDRIDATQKITQFIDKTPWHYLSSTDQRIIQQTRMLILNTINQSII
jgi:hypothetical protein